MGEQERTIQCQQSGREMIYHALACRTVSFMGVIREVFPCPPSLNEKRATMAADGRFRVFFPHPVGIKSRLRVQTVSFDLEISVRDMLFHEWMVRVEQFENLRKLIKNLPYPEYEPRGYPR